MKDPAVLFYFQDFLVGTEFMNDEEVGKYIRILCHQADKGALSESQLKRICRSEVPEAIKEKLKINGDGKYYQERMKIEKEKREKHIEHQRENANKRWKKSECDGNATAMPLLNENENRNINRNENEERRKIDFENFRKNYPGTKRGFTVEYENFRKHKDWKDIIEILNLRLDYQRTVRSKKQGMKEFVPEWKNLKTWINQRCWEEEIPVNVKQEILTYKEVVDRFNNGETAIWDQYEQIQINGKKMWQLKQKI